MKIIVLGAGLVGGPMAADLARDEGFHVTVADRDSHTTDILESPEKKKDTAMVWYLAEGSTGSDGLGAFERRGVVQNTGVDTAGVGIYYQNPVEERKGPHLTLAPHTRQTVNVAEVVPNEWSVSTTVRSDNPVVAERAMYWHGSDGVFRRCAHDSVGY